MANTTHQDLEKPADGAAAFDESMNDNADKLEAGRTLYISEYGENVTALDPITAVEADDKYDIADGNDTALQDVVGIAAATRTSGQDGYVYSNGAIVTEGTWDWDLDKPVFVADDKTLSQTPGTNPIMIGIPLAPTMLLISIVHLNFQMAHIADTAAMAAVTAATLTDSSGGGATDNTVGAITNVNNAGSADVVPVADAFAELIEEINALKADVDAAKTAMDNTHTTQDAILERLELLKISATA